jgi:hypothetical protein
MTFGSLIADLLRQHSPRDFNYLARSGQLQTWMQARAKEAEARVAEILAQTPDARNPDGSENPNARRCAEEIVLADLTDFLVDLHSEPPEP